MPRNIANVFSGEDGVGLLHQTAPEKATGGAESKMAVLMNDLLSNASGLETLDQQHGTCQLKRTMRLQATLVWFPPIVRVYRFSIDTSLIYSPATASIFEP